MKIESDGVDFLYYTDQECSVKISVEDFRNVSWWLEVVASYDSNKNKISLNLAQKREVYRRISARFGVEVYDDRLGFINAELIEIDDNKSVLEAGQENG
jgi:hypothetical protein